MKSGSRSPQRGFKHPSPGLVSRGEVNDGTKVVARLRHHVFTALRRHERLRGDAVGGLQLRLANGQRAVRDRRSDETAMGLAGHRLHLACNRLRLGRLGSARGSRPLRVVGGLVVAYGLVGLAWPFAPMHVRGAELTLTDTMHIVFAIMTVLLTLLAIGF